MRQHTLNNAIGCRGTGLHSGSKVAVTLAPAEPDTGIRFQRTDADANDVEIAAHIDNVVEAAWPPFLGNGDGVSIGTVEHLLAALAGCGIDNAIIEVDGPEVPILDGSAEPFVFLIESAGIAAQKAPRRAIEVLKRIEVGDGACKATLEPADCLSVEFHIEFDDSAIGQQATTVQLLNGAFKHEIAPARTFGFAHHAESLRKRGLALGANLDNAIVIRDGSVINDGGLRYRDEFVRHKILDCIGDLYLVGAPLIGHFAGYCSGHALNHVLVRALLSDRSAWRRTSATATDAGHLRAGQTAMARATA